VIRALLRHPWLRWLGQTFRNSSEVQSLGLVWLVLFLWCLWSRAYVGAMLVALTPFLGVTLGIVLLAGLDGAMGFLRAHARRHRLRLRFLCPGCLQFHRFRFACVWCHTEVEAALVDPHDLSVNHCPICRAPAEVLAYCRECEGRFDPAIYHARQVRVLGTLLPQDFNALQGATPVKAGRAQRVRFLRLDDGRRFTYVVDVSASADAVKGFSAQHAAHEVEAIWLDGADITLLQLGQAIDRYLRWTGMPPAKQRQIAVCVGQDSLEAGAQRLLEARFGSIRYGIPAAEFLG
jgi:hypothetical protein